MSGHGTCGLTLAEQLDHPWTAPFGLVREGDELRPLSPHFATLARLAEQGKTSLVLRLGKEALEHPTTGAELSRLRWAFLTANLGPSEPQLSQWLAGDAKEPLKLADRRAEQSIQGKTVTYSISKTRGKFWPFS